MYEVSYHIKGLRGIFPNDFVLTDNLEGVVAALDSMASDDENIIIMELQSGAKTVVWWRPPYYVFEVMGPCSIFSKSFSREALVAVLSDIERVAARPSAFGFDVESY